MPSLERIFSYLRENIASFEVLVVDDGSSDKMIETIREKYPDSNEFRLLSYASNRGKGYAVRFGAKEAQGDFVLISDADLSTPIEEVTKMLKECEGGADFVIGSRALAKSQIRERQPLYREVAGKFFNLLVRLAVLPDLHDTQCGFKLFRREAMAPVIDTLEIEGFAFDVEMLAMARAMGLKIIEVPVVWINSPTSRVKLSAAGKAYVDILKIRRRTSELVRSRRIQS